MHHSNCPTDATLHRFNEGLVNSDEELDEIADHLGNCQLCTNRLFGFDPGQLQSRLLNQNRNLGRSTNLEDSGHIDSNVASILESVAPPQRNATDYDRPYYEVIESLGADDLFQTYLANDVFLQKRVMLKIVKRNLLNSIDSQTLFHQDVERYSNLNHPRILPLVRIGRWDSLHKYLVFPAVNHLALNHWMTEGNTFDLPALLAVFGQVCDALDYAHSQGVVHRHLEPENIFLDTDGNLMVSEFGLMLDGRYQANLIEPLETPPQFASPETTQNVPAHIDFRADIYSAGKLLAYLLAKTETDPEACQALTEIAKKCIRYSRKSRYQTVNELTHAVFEALSNR